MDRTPIHITRWGDSGPRVILVHGGVQGTDVGGERNFSMQKPLAERGWQLIVPDRPGHGGSPDPGRPDDAEADAVWVADLLAEDAHLVGHSFGGCVVLAAAAKRPAAVRSLTLIEPGMHNLAIGNWQVKRFILSMMMAMLFSRSAVSRAQRVMKILGIPPELAQKDPEVLERMSRNLARGKLPTKAALQHGLREVRKAEIPLLVVTGGWSPAFEATADMVAAAANGRRAVVHSGHHFPQLVSDEVTRLLETFMRENDASRPARGAVR